ncbi:sensor histidine kinase [uncultured Eubacterium sp.]|uniref:cache domain-containing sensor histidine kinase n=1 Tax=uncultured Eubacterium sp. TaxID=165185 RepID=UPI0025E7D2CA|nr:sensor histidine kinase [uncultured Eubacterium sp.]MCI6536300.1 histidine kinase [Lachnospiraceae bacterium]
MEKIAKTIHKTNEQSFRRRLLLSIFRIAAPVTAIVCAVSVIMLTLNYRQTVINSQAAATEKVRSDIAHIIDNTQTLSQDMIFNSEIQKILASSTAGEQFPQNADVAYHVNGFIANRDYINCVILTGNNQTLYSTEKAFTNISDYDTIIHSTWLEQLQNSQKPYLWFVDPDYTPVSDDPTGSDTSDSQTSGANFFRTSSNAPQHIMMARPVYSMSDYTTRLGYLMLYLDDSYIRELMGEFDFGHTTNTWLVNSDGTAILQNKASADYSYLLEELSPQEQGTILSSHGKRFVLNIRPVTDNGWYLYTATPFREVSEPLIIFVLQAILLGAALTAILFFLALRTASSLSDPIIRLAHTMDHYRSDMKPMVFPGRTPVLNTDPAGSPRFAPDTTNTAATSASDVSSVSASHAQPAALEDLSFEGQPDEIVQIYRSYQQMVNRMDTLIRENFVKNLEKKDAELALLQSQINPHFLYNTLDSINWLAIANDQDEISEMVTALSDMFRLSLTKSHSSYIQVAQEMEYVRSYLVLQQFRYQDCLNVSITIPDTVAELYIPRFTLQPLVENAIKHGMISPDDPFSIDLEIFIRDDALHIWIGNDGTHICLERMKELLDFDASRQELLDFDQKSYGVQNIQRRIQILCGISYGLSYEIQDDRTWCDLKLPVLEHDPSEKND